ncbi:MAG: metallophosphoesterase [Desulfosarcina sp.]|nr:metallophosphoesterase [Desulfobacterales bacterium]
MQAFNLVHLTDFHLFDASGASRRAFFNKRVLSYLSWRLYRGQKNPAGVLSDVLDFLPTLAWDQVVITGDLTHMGLPLECRLARQHLDLIGAPDRVFVIPGNHDAMVPSASEVFFDLWSDYMCSDENFRPSGDFGPDCYPTVRIRNGIVLIGLSSARPTRPFSAAGRLGESQCRRLTTILKATGKKRFFRVVLVHHPLLPGQVSRRKGLQDAAELRAILGQYGAELVLHGHTHRHSCEMLPGPAELIPVLGLPSTTAVHPSTIKNACLRVFSIRPEAGGWQIERHDYLHSDRGRMIPLASPGGLSVFRIIPNTPI